MRVFVLARQDPLNKLLTSLREANVVYYSVQTKRLTDSKATTVNIRPQALESDDVRVLSKLYELEVLSQAVLLSRFYKRMARRSDIISVSVAIQVKSGHATWWERYRARAGAVNAGWRQVTRYDFADRWSR